MTGQLDDDSQSYLTLLSILKYPSADLPMTGHNLLRKGGAMNAESKYNAISKLALLSSNCTDPQAFAIDLIHDVFKGLFKKCEPTGIFISRLNRDGNLKMIASYGYSESSISSFEVISIWDSTPCSDAIREKKIIIMHRPSDFHARYPKITNVLNHQFTTLAVPMFFRLGVIGSFTVTFKNCQSDFEVDEDFWAGVASICSFFLVNISKPNNQPHIHVESIFLTDRQKKIVNHFKDGLTIQEIANKLGYSHSTIRQEIIKIYRLLGVRDRKSAISLATSSNLL